MASSVNQPETVLVVDDDDGIKLMLQRSLGRLGYQVICESDGDMALHIVKQSSPNVILLDLHMPKMDGHTFLRRLESQGSLASVVVMSGAGNMDDVIEVLRHGAVDYLTKPWSLSTLVAAVSRAAEVYEQRATKKEVDVSVSAESPPSPEPSEAAARFASLLERVKNGEILIPAIPSVVSEIRRLVQQPDANLTEVVALVERDPSMATHLLRISNTAYYARGGHNSDLKTAVSRIGLRQIHGIAETVFLNSCYKVQNREFQAIQARVWRYSMARAASMRALVDLIRGGPQLDADRAYVAGLLSDVGASFLLWLLAERSQTRDQAIVSRNESITFVRDNHASIGGHILANWNLDPIVIELASTHHAEAPPARHNEYWTLSTVASKLADQLVEGGDVTQSQPCARTVLERCTLELKIGETILQKMIPQLRREIEGMPTLTA